MTLSVQYLTPRYGQHYAKGYVGFTYRKDHLFARGTAWFTRWERMSDIKVTHALLVTGTDECVEAVGSGVRRGDLRSYFDDPNCQIFFRKPKDLNEDIAERLKETAYQEIGKEYDDALITSAAISGSFLGHFLARITHGKTEEWLAKMLDHKDKWICSELVAYCLDQQPEYRDRGILRTPNAAINPQELFEDDIIFEPWHREQ